ncbi:alpha/beta fold hydrolase [Streptomyces bobili]|uniref:alpha/beta fold hydrolase n=1 Tax=Streptomyces bobili TaxID=67280 RepID=UPI0037AB65F3
MSTFLLVHGAWHSGRCWERVVPLLESAGHRAFAPSLTGYGDKAHLLGPEVGLDTHVEDVLKLIHEEDLTEVVLVGHSYAGLVVSSVANEVPIGLLRAAGVGIVQLDMPTETEQDRALRRDLVTRLRAAYIPPSPRRTTHARRGW